MVCVQVPPHPPAYRSKSLRDEHSLACSAVAETHDRSSTPLAKKLGIKEGGRLALLGAPRGFDSTLGELPPRVETRTQARGSFDVVVLFTTRRAELERRLDALTRAIHPAGGLWIA